MEQDKERITLAKIEEMSDMDGRVALEIGCGDGRITSDLAGRPKRLIAIDPDEDNLKAARANIPDVDFRIGSGERLEFPDESFDLILFTLSLHHQDGSKALEEAFRVLKTDGRVLVIEPAVDGEIQSLCTLIDDETEYLRRAAEVVEAGDFKLEKSDIFFTDWVFADREEVHRWLADFYQVSFDSKLTDQVDAFLGEKVEEKPLVLKDKLLITVLKK